MPRIGVTNASASRARAVGAPRRCGAPSSGPTCRCMSSTNCTRRAGLSLSYTEESGAGRCPAGWRVARAMWSIASNWKGSTGGVGTWGWSWGWGLGLRALEVGYAFGLGFAFGLGLRLGLGPSYPSAHLLGGAAATILESEH